MRCIKCQHTIPDNASFCTVCGQRIPRCPTCKSLLTTRAKFCTKDGTRIPEEILELIPDVPPVPVAPKQRFCTRCGKPCRADQTVCDACQNQAAAPTRAQKTAKKQKKSRKGLLAILIVLALLLGLAAGGYFAMDSGLIDTPDWLSFIDNSDDNDRRDEEEDEEEEDEDEEEEEEEDARNEAVAETAAPPAEAPWDAPVEEVPAVDAPVAEAPAVDAPVAEAPAVEVPATEAPAVVGPALAIPEYLYHLPRSYSGKIWTRCADPFGAPAHTNADAPACWNDLSLPGHTQAPVYDNQGNQYYCGMHVDGPTSQVYTLTFYPEGKYTLFTGVCACPEAATAISDYVYNTSTAYTKYFDVYADGNLIFTSDTMRYDSQPQYFELDITGVQTLTIAYPATPGPNEIATLYDALFW